MEIYRLSYNFVFDIYNITKNFPKSEDNNLTWQMRRAAVSIPINIVEGSTLESMLGIKSCFDSILTRINN